MHRVQARLALAGEPVDVGCVMPSNCCRLIPLNLGVPLKLGGTRRHAKRFSFAAASAQRAGSNLVLLGVSVFPCIAKLQIANRGL
jgi:hypothetical protein